MMRPSKGIGAPSRRRIKSATMHLFLHNSAICATRETALRKGRFAAAATLIPALAAALVLAGAAHAKPKSDPASASAAPATADAEPHPVLDRIRSSGRIVLAHRE